MTHPAPGKRLPFLLALLLSGLAIGLALALGSSDAAAAQLAARWTARTSVLIFLVTYLARPLAQAWPDDLTRGILARRRQWGLAFALAHTIHLGAVVTHFAVSGTDPPLVSVLGGGLGYLLIWASAVTSNTASIRAMGRGWKGLHRTTIHYVWLIFFQSYAGRVAMAETRAIGLVFAGLLLGAALVRVIVWARLRNRSLRASV